MRGFVVAVVMVLQAVTEAGAQREPLGGAWPIATRDARPWTRWWWLGSAVDSASLRAELGALAAAGFGGVEITAIYGVRGMEARDISYLSPQWVALLRFATAEARRLGLGVDLPPGSGWRAGGPGVSLVDANASLRVVIDTVDRVERFTLHTPFSGDLVKRPAPGGEGRAIDPFSRETVQRYLDSFASRLASLSAGGIRSFFHDSFEYTGAGSRELAEAFRARRGYELASELPALVGRGDRDRVARVKSDYRQTIDEMLLDHFARPLARWSKAQGAWSRNQAHGSPGNLLDLYAAADIPETEIFGPLGGGDNDPLVSKFASSAAHLAGRSLTSAEAFTWLGEHFSTTLDEAKRAADQLFIAGINHLIYHGTAFSPLDAAWPGWQFYASMEWNPRNAFWLDVPAFNAYVTRVQSVLQSSAPDNDVLLYWPIWDNWHDPAGLRMDFRVHAPAWLRARPVGRVADALWRAGIGFDYASDRLLIDRVRAVDGVLRAGPARWRAIIVPAAERMPPETLERLLTLADAGATVMFVDALPGDVPGLHALQERRDRLARARRVLDSSSARGVPRAVRHGRGRVLVDTSLFRLIAAAQIVAEPMASRALRFVRRRSGAGVEYFVSNSGDPIDAWIPLAVEASSVVIRDPMRGTIGVGRVRRSGRRTEVRLQLATGESTLLTARRGTAPVLPAWRYVVANGAPVRLTRPWSVHFTSGGPGRPTDFRSDSLVPWTGRGDAEADRYAGIARYSITFDAPPGRRHRFDLGRVAESARVRLNGRELGILVARPFTVETDALRPRGNLLEVEVTNLSANRIRDLDRRHVPWKIFRDINYVGIDYRPFDASSWPVRTSGLVGPVTVQVIE